MARFRDEKGRFISAPNLTKKLGKIGMNISDYENARKFYSSSGSDSIQKDIYEQLENIGDVREIEQSDTDLVRTLSEMPKNRGKAFLNGERVTKMQLAQFITDYSKEIGVPVHYLYINHKFEGYDTYVNLDNELIELLEEADFGDETIDSNGNRVRTATNEDTTK